MDSQKINLLRRLTTLENLPSVLLVVLLVLVPVVCSYSPFLSFLYLKALVISIGVLFTFAISILAIIKRGTVSFPKNLIAATLVVLVLAIFISSLASSSPIGSLLGYGFEATTFSFILIMAVLAYLASISFSSVKKLYVVNTTFLVLAGVLGLFHTLRLFFGAKFLPLGFFTSVTTNTIGSVNELGIFFGISMLLSLFALEILKLKKIQKVAVYVILFLSLFVMMVVNFSTIWIVAGIIITIFFVYSAAHSTAVAERISGTLETTADGRLEMPRRRIALKFLIVAIIALVFVLPLGRDIASNLGAKFGVSSIEVRPSWGATLAVFKANFKADPILGTGPNRFSIAWQMYRPDINLTNFWNTNFESAIGFVPTSIIETGILGMLMWFVFLGSIVWLGIKSLFSSYGDRVTRFLVMSSLAVVVYLWAMNIFYAPGTVVLFLTFFFTGLFMASTAVAHISINKLFEFIKYPKIGFISTMVGVIVLVAVVGLSYVVFEQGRASVSFQKALTAVTQNTDAETAEAKILDAIRLSKRDIYYRSLAQLNLSKINTLIAAANGQKEVTEAQRTEFQTRTANAVEAARLAQLSDPLRLENQLIVAQVYSAIVPIGVEGSYEAAKTGYEEANKVSPRNPQVYLALAQLAASNKDLKAAQEYLDQSLGLKANYIDAIFFQAQLDATQGNLSAAIKRVEQIVALTPNDPLNFFRLGLLKYDAKEYTGAVAAFEKSISLVPVYANAKYFLGLSYAQAGETAKAIKIFEELSDQNPNNPELAAILVNLKAGRGPFTAATPTDVKPEKRKGLPITESH